jgi:hypothetical protein
MMHFVQMVFPSGGTWDIRWFNVQLDNCRVHFSKATERFFAENQPLHVPRQPYIPDSAPWDVWQFGYLKIRLTGRSCAEPEELSEVD